MAKTSKPAAAKATDDPSTGPAPGRTPPQAQAPADSGPVDIVMLDHECDPQTGRILRRAGALLTAPAPEARALIAAHAARLATPADRAIAGR